MHSGSCSGQQSFSEILSDLYHETLTDCEKRSTEQPETVEMTQMSIRTIGK